MKIKKFYLPALAVIIPIMICEMPLPAGASAKPIPVIKSFMLNDAPLKDVARLMSEGTGMTVIATDKAAQTKVTVFIENQNCENILRAVCRANGLWFRKEPDTGIIYILTLDEYKKSLNLYSEEDVEVIQVFYPAVEDVGETLKDLFQDKVFWTLPNEDAGDESFRIDRALERMDKLAERGQFALQDEANSSDNNNDDDDDDDDDDDNSSSRKYNKNRQMNSTKDIEQSQSITDEYIYRMGRKLSQESAKNNVTGKPGMVYVAALPTSNTILLRSSDKKALERVKKVIKQIDKPSPQVLLEVKVLELNISDEHRRGIDWLFSDGDFSGGFANGIPNIDGQGGGNQILKPDSDLVPQGTGLDEQAAVFNYVSKHVRARVQMMELDGNVKSLATPMLLVTDSEASRIFVGSESTILTKVEATSNTTSGDNPVTVRSYNPTTERRNIGTSLLITPRIHADRTVTVRIMQENSAAGDTKQIVYGIDDAGNQLYFDTTDINQRTVTTTVLAKNTQVIAVGGLITEEDEDSVEGIPWIMDVPVLGEAFERITRVKVRTELIILIRPYVLLAPGEGESISMELLEKLSEHPSAKKDLPELGIGRAKPFRVAPDDPWYRKLYGKLKTWDTAIDWGEDYDYKDAVIFVGKDKEKKEKKDED